MGKLSALPANTSPALADLFVMIQTTGPTDVKVALSDILAAINTNLPNIQQAWQTPTLQNSWVQYDTIFGTAQYYKDSTGVVHLRGLLKNGTVTAGTSLFTLPAGYRPVMQMLYEVTSNDARARLDVKTDGTVTTGPGVSNLWVSLANMSFRAEA